MIVRRTGIHGEHMKTERPINITTDTKYLRQANITMLYKSHGLKLIQTTS